MSPAGRLTVREVLQLLREDGWAIVEQKGSHRQLRHAEKPGRVTVAGKASLVLPPKTLASIMRQAGLRGSQG